MKTLFVLLALLLSLTGFSQLQLKKPITKGNMLISGGGTFQYQKDTFSGDSGDSETSHFFLTFTPGVAYFIVNNFALGANISAFYNGSENNKYYSLGFGPMLRYYFNNGIFLKTDADYLVLHNISSSTDNEKYFSVVPGAGYAFFLNPKVSLEPCICYEFDNIDFNSSNKQKINAVKLELKLAIFL